MIAAALSGQVGHPSQELTCPINSELMRPAMIVWNGGLVETITRASLGSRKTWRITHYPQDPTSSKTNDYDLYDLDQTALKPLRSVMNAENFRLELIFADQEVTFHKTTDHDDITEKIPLSTPVCPEGPGLDVFLASLPLRVGYTVRYAIVDRWGGHGATRVKTVTLSVLQRITEDTLLGKQDIYQVLLRGDDDSFQIKEKVLAKSPHFPISVEYTREGKTYPKSEVITIVSQM